VVPSPNPDIEKEIWKKIGLVRVYYVYIYIHI
jgi:hypothetical protein